jgi:hypothetical protein
MDDVKTYQVTTTYAVKATSPEEAALQAYSLGNDLTPTEYAVTDPDGETTQVMLNEHQAEEALVRAFKGTLFPAS